MIIFSKIFFCFALLLVPAYTWALNVPERPDIISRSEWGASESYSWLYGEEWTEILAERKKRSQWAPPADPAAAKKSRENYQKSLNYINANYAHNYKVDETVYYDEAGKRLAWPIKYSKNVNAIVVHHTHTEYEDTQDGLERVQKFHSLSREWWDIGYNFIIGYDGKIYEARKWWDYAVWAHSTWNNYSTMGVAVMWSYQSDGINAAQYTSLKDLIWYLSWRYGIDLNKERAYHANCSGSACDSFPLETYTHGSLVWHRDTGHTTCPWDKLYEQINDIRSELAPLTKWFTLISRWETVPQTREINAPETPIMQKIISLLQWYSQQELQWIHKAINKRLETEKSEPKRRMLQMIKIGILSIVRD